MSTAKQIDALLMPAKPRRSGPCHTIDHRGWALCGSFGPGGGAGKTHSHKQCIAKKHLRCVTCNELGRQMDNYRMGT